MGFGLTILGLLTSILSISGVGGIILGGLTINHFLQKNNQL